MTAEIISLAEHRAARAGNSKYAAEQFGLKASKRNGLSGILIRKERRWADHRAEPRHEMAGRCALDLTLNGKSAVVRNISGNGIMAEIDIEAPLGSRLLANFVGSRPLSARVVWKRNGLVGLEIPLSTAPQ